MFDHLSTSLQRLFKSLRGYGKLTERNIQDALREVRLALLEADVHYQVVKDFTARVREQCLGAEVLDSITPGQQVIKRIHDELVRLLGGERRDFDLRDFPAGILLFGLHGSGKTTTAAKLAAMWKRAGRRPLLAACDLRRPAAVEQLGVLARGVGVDFAAPPADATVPAAAAKALERARTERYDTIIYDTGGRFQIDDELIAELKETAAAVRPRNRVLVLDAAIGQESVHVAQTFHEALDMTGLILTKLDGDARGGAALSVVSVTGRPILLAGVGEKTDDLVPFHPDRMASRILGMGDVVSLVERAEQTLDREAAEQASRKLAEDRWTLEDLLDQLRQVRKMGPMDRLLDMLPGAGPGGAALRPPPGTDPSVQLQRTEAVILSMTPMERRHPERIDGRRRARIARGSGTTVADVNDLLRQFEQMKRMMKQLRRRQKGLRRRG